MRIEGSITAVSWIPSEAVTGLAKLPFGSGVAHYDDPPPDHIDPTTSELEALRDADRFRFANRLSAFVDIDDDGHIVAAGYSGGGLIGVTNLSVGTNLAIAAVPLPDKQAEPEVGPTSVRFLQTAGGRTGVPAPRTVRRPPFVQYHAPIAWSTLSLTIGIDGSVTGELLGASPFPRHWVYDATGRLAAKTGVIDFKSWYKDAFGAHTPWGDLDSPALVTAVESALERELSTLVMRSGAKPQFRRVREGEVITAQGDPSEEIFVVLDGVIGVEVDGNELGQLGPGAVLGERSVLEGGRRTATLRAATDCRLAVARGVDLDRGDLERLSLDHRREEASN